MTADRDGAGETCAGGPVDPQVPVDHTSARGGVPLDQPEVAASGVPVEDHDRSHLDEPIPLHGRREDQPRDLKVIGTRQRKTDGLAKSTGRARYTDDITLPGMLHGKILRSPHPHARILSIDTSAAQALPGVHAVVTGAEMPTPFGIIVWTPDEHALALDRVRYIGDAVAAVAAVDEETANRAAGADPRRVRGAGADPGPARGRAPHRRADPRGEEGRAQRQHQQDGGAGVRRRGERAAQARTWWSRAITSSRAPRTRPSSRTAPSASGRREARPPGDSPSGRPRRCRTTCTASWPACWSWIPPRSA